MLKIDILGIKFDNVTFDEAMDKLKSFLLGNEKKIIVTPNAEIAQLCAENKEINELINKADFIVPDGIGVIYASKILKKPLKQKVAGVDLAFALLPILEKEKKTLFLFGGKDGVAEKAKEKIKEKYPNIIINGILNGYYSNEEEIIKEINKVQPDVLFVCLGAPKQEKFMVNNKEKINARLMFGFGGVLDVISGNAKRAPKIFVQLGLEWFYRLLSEPKRFKRMLKLPKYLMNAILFRFKGE